MFYAQAPHLATLCQSLGCITEDIRGKKMAHGLKKQSLANIMSGSTPVTGGLAGISNGGLLSGVCDSIGALSESSSAPSQRHPGNDIAGLTRSGPKTLELG